MTSPTSDERPQTRLSLDQRDWLRALIDQCQVIVLSTGGELPAQLIKLESILPSIPDCPGSLEDLFATALITKATAYAIASLPQDWRSAGSSLLIGFAAHRNAAGLRHHLNDFIARLNDSLYAGFTESSTLDPRATEALTYVDEHYRNAQLSLSVVARHVNLSAWYLSRLLKRSCGTGFYDYVHHVRMAEAERLLIATHMSVKEVAVTVGYGDTRQLDRHFRSSHGITPGVWRHNSKK